MTERNAIGYGKKGPRLHRGANLVIAGSDCPDALRDYADWCCDGSDDELVIMDALAELPEEGGRILFAGTFNCGSAIVWDGTGWYMFEAAGYCLFTSGAAIDIWQLTGAGSFTFKGMEIDGDSTALKGVETASAAFLRVVGCNIHDCLTANVDHNGQLHTDTINEFNGQDRPEAEMSIRVVGNSSAVAQQDYQDHNYLVEEILDGYELQALRAKFKDPGVTDQTDINLVRVREEAAIGGSDTQFDITNPAGDTHRYTFDGTGTDPGIEDDPTSLEVGDEIVFAAQNFSAGNNGKFTITGVGDNYIEVTNASGVVESDKTIGTGSIVPIKHRDMLTTPVEITTDYKGVSTDVDTDYDDLQEGDDLYPTVSALHSGTAPNGLTIALVLKKP